MATLGRCLLFYLKYGAEMERLYEADEPNVEGLPNPDQALETTKRVGDAASHEAAEFLKACALVIEKRLASKGLFHRVRTNLEETWELKYRIAPKGGRIADARRRFVVGVSFDFYPPVVVPRLVPWVWCRGGRRAQDEMIRILGRVERAPAGWGSGTVALATIDIPIPGRLDDPVESEPLLERVGKAFDLFTADHVAAIAKIPGNR